MAPAAESIETPVPIHLDHDVHILFIAQGAKTWATMVFGGTTVELGPVDPDDAYYEGILRLAAGVLIEHPRWIDEVFSSADREIQIVRIGRWVLTYRGPTSHSRLADDAQAKQVFAVLASRHQ